MNAARWFQSGPGTKSYLLPPRCHWADSASRATSAVRLVPRGAGPALDAGIGGASAGRSSAGAALSSTSSGAASEPKALLPGGGCGTPRLDSSCSHGAGALDMRNGQGMANDRLLALWRDLVMLMVELGIFLTCEPTKIWPSDSSTSGGSAEAG